MRSTILGLLGLALWAGTCAAGGRSGFLETDDLPSYLRDRGAGMPLSIPGTYVQNGQLLVYPFFEYYYDANFEYSPADFNYLDEGGFHGKYTATEQLLLLGFGISDRLAIEVEGAIIQAKSGSCSACNRVASRLPELSYRRITHVQS